MLIHYENLAFEIEIMIMFWDDLKLKMKKSLQKKGGSILHLFF